MRESKTFAFAILYAAFTELERQCDNAYHLKCLNPPLSVIPEGEWFCDSCTTDIGAAMFSTLHEEKKFVSDQSTKGRGNTKRKASDAGNKVSGV
jgi:hypothetical protein